MTREDREKAIEILRADSIVSYSVEDILSARDMAIKALEQEPNTRHCFGCKYSKDNHNQGIEECHLCMWENQYTPTTKNNLGVDAVSRQEVLDLIAEYDLSMGQVVRGIHALSSVTPQEPRKGHWMLRNSFLVPYKCSECNYKSERYDNYCPNCGAKMVEPQKSEGKDADKKCTYKETGCGSCKRQLDCPIEAERSDKE